jgi:hypothetical protein
MRAYNRIAEMEMDFTAYKNQLYREFLEKNMAIANGLCSTTGTVHSGFISKQITRQLETARSSPCSMYNAVILNTWRTVKRFWQNREEEVLVSETVLFGEPAELLRS